MTNEGTSELVVLAIMVDDPTLADRLAALLSEVPGLRLARPDETADVALVSLRAADMPPEQDSVLTPRELEVLNLVAEGASNRQLPVASEFRSTRLSSMSARSSISSTPLAAPTP